MPYLRFPIGFGFQFTEVPLASCQVADLPCSTSKLQGGALVAKWKFLLPLPFQLENLANLKSLNFNFQTASYTKWSSLSGSNRSLPFFVLLLREIARLLLRSPFKDAFHMHFFSLFQSS